MGAWQEIVDYTVPSNTTSVVLDSFGTITKDDFVKVVATMVNNSGGSTLYRLFPTSNTTNTNYHRQSLFGSGSSVGAGRSNENLIGGAANGATVTNYTYVKLSENDKFNAFSNSNWSISSSLENSFFYTTQSTGTTTSITSFTYAARDTNGIGTGSRIQIYKLAAEKVADITVGSNTTQVDISSLSIDKDSEYLLVSDYVHGAAGNNFDLFVNNNTTLTDYYTQRIQGNGSTASASRDNSARVGYLDSNNLRFLSYGHIKLSNIGAYTSQNYSMQDMGTSSMFLRNDFVSSVAENITSITSINVRSRATNGFGVGTRLQLYKLYE
jgi:3D (Asp-Asp-Asp) domain-containing protein